MKGFAILIAGLLLSACSNQPPPPRAVGQLQSDRVDVAFQARARILTRGPVEGSDVAPDTVLYTLDTALIVADLRAADARIAERSAMLSEQTNGTRPEVIAQASADLAGALDTVAFREREFQRLEKLLERALVAPSDVDAARTALDEARALLAVRQSRFEELANGARPEAIERARASLDAATAERDRFAELRDRHTTRSGVHGRLDRYLFEAGEHAAEGIPGAVVLTGPQPHASVFLPAQMRAGLEVGDELEIAIEGRREPVVGRVRWISSETAFTPYFALTERDRGRLSYRAEVTLDLGAERRLPDGLPVEVRAVAEP